MQPGNQGGVGVIHQPEASNSGLKNGLIVKHVEDNYSASKSLIGALKDLISISHVQKQF